MPDLVEGTHPTGPTRRQRFNRQIAAVISGLIQSERLDGSDITEELRDEFGDDAVIEALYRVEMQFDRRSRGGL